LLRGGDPILHLARFSTRRPFLALVLWFAVAAALAARRDTRVLSAWDAGDTGASLRPDATHAMLVASVARTERQMVDGVQAEIDAIIDRKISAPVSSYVAGTPTIDIATKDQSLAAARRAELLALPILFAVLLILLRAPLAALVLTALGGVITLMSFGAMALLGKLVDVDPTGVTFTSMAGLALGAGYGLLVYRRWLYATAAELKKVPKQLNSSKKMRKSVPKVPLVPDPPRHAEGQREEGVRPIAHRGGHVAGRPRRLQGEDLGHVQADPDQRRARQADRAGRDVDERRVRGDLLHTRLEIGTATLNADVKR